MNLTALHRRVSWISTVRYQQLGLVCVDALLIILVFFGVNSAIKTARASISILLNPGAVQATAALALCWLLALWFTGAYSIRHLRSGAEEYKRVLNGSGVAAGAFGIACFLLKYDYPRLTFTLWIATGILSLWVARYVRRQITHRLHVQGMFQTPVLVVGSEHHVDEVASALNRSRWAGYRIVGAVTREHGQRTPTGVQVLGKFGNVTEIIKSHGIDTVIFAEGSFTSPSEFQRLAWKLEEHQVQIMVVPTLADVSAERLDFSPMAGLPLVNVARPRAVWSLHWTKRAMDIAGSAVLLLLASPILVASALAVKMEDGGPIIFRQRRVGLKGKQFDCLKFRSMCVDAEARLAALQTQNEGSGVLFKIADDPRITRVGRFIRRFSVDELPQLWNTLRGDMSLVGPRPALPGEVSRYDSDTMRRLQVRPGLTGLWQVSGRSNLSWNEALRLDLYYVDNWSAVQDMMILMKTAKAVLGSEGAY